MEKRYKSRRESVVCGRWTSWGITAGIPLSPLSMKLACATPPLQISLVYERSRGSRTTWKGKQPSIGIHGVHTGRAWRECEYWYRDNERGTPRVSESTSHPSRAVILEHACVISAISRWLMPAVSTRRLQSIESHRSTAYKPRSLLVAFIRSL